MFDSDMIRPCGCSWQYCNGNCEKCSKVGNLTSLNRTYSQDSETIASLLDKFQYCPEKKENILKKYETLLSSN